VFEGSHFCVFPSECSAGSEVSRRDIRASGSLLMPPRSVAEGPSSFWVLVDASPTRWSRGGSCLAQGRVPCVSCAVALPPVFATLLLLLPAAPTYHTDSSRLLPVVLDAASSRLRSRGAGSWVGFKLLVSASRCLSLLLCFSYSLFPLCLSYLLPSLSVCNYYIPNEIHAKPCSRKKELTTK
jgi:hypothetical protein